MFSDKKDELTDVVEEEKEIVEKESIPDWLGE